MVRSELDAFEAEAAAVEETLALVPSDAWERTALGEWTVAELLAHLVRAVTRADHYLDQPLSADSATHDRIGYWRFDLGAEAPAVAERARRDRADLSPADLVDGFAQGWRHTAARVAALPPDHLLETLRGPMRLDDYLATRVVELVVHHMDLRAALDLPPVPTPAGLRLVTATLDALLDGPRPRNAGAIRYVRISTGRLPSDDPRFPVIR